MNTLDLFFSKLAADFPLNFKHSHVLIVGHGAAKYAFAQHFSSCAVTTIRNSEDLSLIFDTSLAAHSGSTLEFDTAIFAADDGFTTFEASCLEALLKPEGLFVGFSRFDFDWRSYFPTGSDFKDICIQSLAVDEGLYGSAILAPKFRMRKNVKTSAKLIKSDSDSELSGEDAQRRISNLASRIDQLESDLENALSREQAILSSNSWKITKPLRLLSQVMRTVCARLLGVTIAIALKLGLKSVIPRSWKNVIQKYAPSIRDAYYARDAQGEPNSFKDIRKAISARIVESRYYGLSDLKFPAQKAPQVSIIVPAYGDLKMVTQCLASLMLAKTNIPFEVIVSDDASGVAEMTEIGNVDNLIFMNQSINLGFIENCNAAAQTARGTYLYFLNSDTIVNDFWLDNMLTVFETRPDCGLVGSKLIYPDCSLQEAGGILWADGSAWNCGRNGHPFNHRFRYTREIDYASGASLLVETRFFKSLGGFDNEFAPAYCEDSDFAMRTRQVGKRAYLAANSLVVHLEGMSHGTDDSGGIKKYQVINQKKFFERWRTVLKRQHFPPGVELDKAKDGLHIRPRVLFIDHHTPTPDRDAGSKTIFCMLEELLEIGCLIKFVPDNGHFDPTYTPTLEQLGIEVISGPEYHLNQKKFFADYGNFDFVFLSRPHVAKKHLSSIRRYTSARVIYYGHDVHYMRLAAEKEIGKNSIDSSDLVDIRKTELAVWQNVDVICYASNDDLDEVRSQLGPLAEVRNLKLLPCFSYDISKVQRQQEFANRAGIIIIGGANHPPNIDGLNYFFREVLPLIHAELAGTNVEIIGFGMAKKFSQMSNSAIHFHGLVSLETLNSALASAKVSVAPLRYGSGIKGKVVDSLCAGVPTVTTPVGAQGFENPEKIMAVCSDAASMAAQIIACLKSDKVTWTEASDKGLDYARSHFTREKMKSALLEILDDDAQE